MTKATAEALLAKLDNTAKDPEVERQNIVAYLQLGGNFANYDEKDRLATAYRQELLDTIARGDA